MITDKYWKSLKSGTDIRGTAVETVPGMGFALTDDTIARISRAFVRFISDRNRKEATELVIAVGRDSRISGPRISSVFCETAAQCGVRVLDCGLSSTPAMFMTTVDMGCDAAVQITASHHPYDRNGLKFFTISGGFEGSDIEKLLELAEQGVSPDKHPGNVRTFEYMERYAERLRRIICEQVNADNFNRPLEGFRIAVDAGNGAGGFYARDVLEPLGADVSGSRYLDPDGYFPNHVPNPENPDAMKAACEAVISSHSDLGIIFDTDVDRAGCVDDAGKEINRNRLIALAASIVLEGNEGGTIVTDSVTSDGLKQFIEGELHGKHRRFKRGYKNVINETIRLNGELINAPLAIETSGHAALRENFFLDDGAYLVTKIIIKAAQLRREGKTLASLIEKLREPAEAYELRFAITDPDFRTCGNEVLSKLEAYAVKNGWKLADDSREGVRISFGEGAGNGWLLLRLSVHDPVMPLNMESDAPGGCRIIAGKLKAFAGSCAGIDISPLDAFLA